MLNDEDFNHLAEYILLRNIKWRIDGKKRLPTRAELKTVLDDMVRTVRESGESISVEIGGLLVKRTDDHIDVYVHVGEMPFYEQHED